MLPNSWFTLASFFALIAPGALLNSLTSRRRVRPVETALQELARIVLASVTFSLVGVIAASLASLWLPDTVVSPSTLALGQVDDLRSADGSPIATVTVALAVSLGSVLVWNWWASRSDVTTLSPTSSWHQAIRSDLPEGQYPFVRVDLSDGNSYLGRVRSYSPDLDPKEREIVLSPPLMTCNAAGQTKRLDVQWKRIVIAESQIVTLAVAYVADTATSTSTGKPNRPA